VWILPKNGKKNPGAPKWQKKIIRGRYAKQDIFFFSLTISYDSI